MKKTKRHSTRFSQASCRPQHKKHKQNQNKLIVFHLIQIQNNESRECIFYFPFLCKSAIQYASIMDIELGTKYNAPHALACADMEFQMKKLIDAKALAEKLGVSLRMLEDMIVKEQIPPYIKLGRLRRWEETQIDRWIEAQFRQLSNQEATTEHGEQTGN